MKMNLIYARGLAANLADRVEAGDGLDVEHAYDLGFLCGILAPEGLGDACQYHLSAARKAAEAGDHLGLVVRLRLLVSLICGNSEVAA